MYLTLGDKERAIDEMGRAYRERAGNDIALIKVDPMPDDLRGHPRFVVLVHHQSPLQGSSLRAEFRPDENSGGSHSRALAAWVSVGSDPTPIQATGGWLPLQP